MAFLYDILLNEFGRREISKVTIPKIISENLNPRFEIRPYQKEAFQRFFLFYENSFGGKQNKPYHLNFNMATGSGKTLIMAGLILSLFEKGYRNFIFFVNSTNIIEKTKDNFLNSPSLKYLFANHTLTYEGKEIKLNEVQNFEAGNRDNINISFTTIQKLHGDLTTPKENSITIEDFKEYKVVLIADEAHHFNTATRNGDNELFESWENTVLKILGQNNDNILLEFTATLDLEHPEILRKYQNKIIFKYNLKQFRLEGYSKEINLLRSNFEQSDRILQAIILSQYKQEVATTHGVNVKPVILFKAKRTIAESEENKKKFHHLIENLTNKQIEHIALNSTVPIIKAAFAFFESHNISYEILKSRLKSNFEESKCISANNDLEKEKNQIVLNSLEHPDNPYRAIFAVQKLNEGWDVLNLFDIVRLYVGRDSKGNQVGATTISEAQLIGRGARYFPFKVSNDQEFFSRKYDKDLSNDLRVLEELYYHAQEDSRYISELTSALVESGIYENEENLVEKELILKDSFKKTKFYKTGLVHYNEKVPKSFNHVKSIADMGVSRRNFEIKLHSGAGGIITVLEETKDSKEAESAKKPLEIELKGIQHHIKRRVLCDNPFFRFESLKKYFKNLKSLSEFIDSNEYLNSLSITLVSTDKQLKELTNKDYYYALGKLLNQIEDEIKGNLTEYVGTRSFKYSSIHSIFQNKTIRINKNDERLSGQEEVVGEADWYVYNANYGTTEEKAFVKMFAQRYEHLKKTFKEIYLVRNERVLKIFNFEDGQAFEPDFILFAKQKEGEQLIYQVFIEPKGSGFIAKDMWKERFLKEIRELKTTIEISTDKYLITGVPFYNNENENEFKIAFEEALNE